MSISFLKNLEQIMPYVGGMPIEELSRKIGISENNIIKLASNENPYGISPKTKKAIQDFIDFNLYPDGSGYELIKTISKKFNLDPEQVVLGNGSNDILELAARIVVSKNSEIMFSEHAFAVYNLVAKSIGAQENIIPSKNYAHDLLAFEKHISKNTKLIFIANPNNPTGTYINKNDLYRFISKVPSEVLIVLDEAYDEYLDEEDKSEALKWVKDFNNLLVSRSFSKAYGLASLRIGYGISSKAVIEMINRVRQPFNANSIAQVAANAAIKDSPFVEMSYEKNKEQKLFMENAFKSLNIDFIKSYGNFISFQLGSADDAVECYEYLLKKGIILRPISNYGMPKFLRVSIGTPKENKTFIEVLSEFLGKNK